MKEPIQKYFQVGVIQWMSYPHRDPIESLRAICADSYFDAVEIKGYGARNAEARALLGPSHLAVCYGAQPRLLGPKLNPNSLEILTGCKVEASLAQPKESSSFVALAVSFTISPINLTASILSPVFVEPTLTELQTLSVIASA